jgi:hypothetical protein
MTNQSDRAPNFLGAILLRRFCIAMALCSALATASTVFAAQENPKPPPPRPPILATVDGVSFTDSAPDANEAQNKFVKAERAVDRCDIGGYEAVIREAKEEAKKAEKTAEQLDQRVAGLEAQGKDATRNS